MIAFIQPHIPHYRDEFFEGLIIEKDLELFCFESLKEVESQKFKNSKFHCKSIKNISVGPFLLYNPLSFMHKKYTTLVLMLNFSHFSTWLLLLLNKLFFKKKIIVWGQGISVKRYLKEEKKVNFLLKLMIWMSDSTWLYTEKEKKQWLGIFPYKDIVALNNTISGVDKIINFKSPKSKDELKKQYSINNEICIIFCARFNSSYRRTDLLETIIYELDKDKYSFIIIGEGKFKPDFSVISNVHDFGAVYDKDLKDDLFTIADLYLQPGWVGLSIVEALAYGKPVVTFIRSLNTLQCVEYEYLVDGYNSVLLSENENYIDRIHDIEKQNIEVMGVNAKTYVKNNLMMENMISQALKTI